MDTSLHGHIMEDNRLHPLEVIDLLVRSGVRGQEVAVPKGGEVHGTSIVKGGCTPKPEKVQAIKEIAVPRNMQEIRAFLGTGNY